MRFSPDQWMEFVLQRRPVERLTGRHDEVGGVEVQISDAGPYKLDTIRCLTMEFRPVEIDIDRPIKMLDDGLIWLG